MYLWATDFCNDNQAAGLVLQQLTAGFSRVNYSTMLHHFYTDAMVSCGESNVHDGVAIHRHL